MSKSLQSLVERKLIPTGKSGNDIIYCCPKCNDTSGHLYVDYNKGYFHCFKCDYSGRSLIPLLNDLGIDIRFDYESLENSYDEELKGILQMDTTPSKRVVDYSKNLKVITEYYNYHTMPLSQQALDYLHHRGLRDDMIEKLQIREGINRYNSIVKINSKEYAGVDYSGRIMVPSLKENGTISYFVARDYIGDKLRKYLNPNKQLAFSSEDVWSLDIVETPYVIICEGVFTAIAVNTALGKLAAVATYGKSISARSNSDNPTISVTSQGEKLLAKKFSLYIIFYDKDAKESALNTCKYLYDRGAHVKLVTIPEYMYGDHADANDMKAEEIKQLIVDSKDYNQFTIIDDLS